MYVDRVIEFSLIDLPYNYVTLHLRDQSIRINAANLFIWIIIKLKEVRNSILKRVSSWRVEIWARMKIGRCKYYITRRFRYWNGEIFPRDTTEQIDAYKFTPDYPCNRINPANWMNERFELVMLDIFQPENSLLYAHANL